MGVSSASRKYLNSLTSYNSLSINARNAVKVINVVLSIESFIEPSFTGPSKIVNLRKSGEGFAPVGGGGFFNASLGPGPSAGKGTY